MQGGALPPPHQVSQIRWLIAALLLGGAGSMVGIAAFGTGSYRIGPIVVEMKAMPSTEGTTQLAVEPIASLRSGFAEADTHLGFLSFRGTVTGVVFEPDALLATESPFELATFIQEQGANAMRRFALRIGLVTLAGGAAGGMAVALIGMRARRVFQGMIAAVVLVGALGLVAWQTYDIEEFEQGPFPTGESILPGG